MKRFVFSFVLNSAMTACAVLGLFYGTQWALNIMLFMVWVSCVAGTLAMLCKDAKLKSREKGRSVPAWLAISNDIVVLALLVSVGRFITATAQLWAMACEYNIYEGKD